ncbi:MAG TPA: hypothetical protein VMF91_02125 [Bryobacteraceae bacterium]|nr:hypothetical protein [Bryobacteraceae bacterium]
MPINEASFWFGITVFGTGLFGLMEGGNRMPYAIALTVIGLIVTAYSVVAHHKPEVLPKIPIWIGLLALTWAAVGFDYYDRHHVDYSKWSDIDKLERVPSRVFKDETVVLDGKFFLQPTFENVTFIYNGTAGVAMDNAHFLPYGRFVFRLGSRNPVVTTTLKLDSLFYAAGGCGTWTEDRGNEKYNGMTPPP